MSKAAKLTAELANASNEPNVEMLVDATSIYWNSESCGPVWIADHNGMSNYVDDNHQPEEGPNVEGVGSTVVRWNNVEFESPFHISEFYNAVVKNINV